VGGGAAVAGDGATFDGASVTDVAAGTNVTFADDGDGTITINVSAGTATVGDGDYGDVTVSSNGTVWSVDEAAVTQHQAALTITESQISDLGDYVPEPTAGGDPYARTHSPDGWVRIFGLALLDPAGQAAGRIPEADGADGVRWADESASLTTSLASLDFVGAGVAASDDSEGNVTVTIDAAGTAASTSYDNTTSGLTATDVQAALDEIEARTGAPVTALIAGADAAQDVKDATSYVEGTDNIETVIAQALADGYRSLLLTGTCTATAAVDVDTGDAVDIWSAPGATLVGDLTVSVAGARVRLDVAVTGTITDGNDRIVRPYYERRHSLLASGNQTVQSGVYEGDPSGGTLTLSAGEKSSGTIIVTGNAANIALGSNNSWDVPPDAGWTTTLRASWNTDAAGNGYWAAWGGN
jgi:hypothetical protein